MEPHELRARARRTSSPHSTSVAVMVGEVRMKTQGIYHHHHVMCNKDDNSHVLLVLSAAVVRHPPLACTIVLHVCTSSAGRPAGRAQPFFNNMTGACTRQLTLHVDCVQTILLLGADLPFPCACFTEHGSSVNGRLDVACTHRGFQLKNPLATVHWLPSSPTAFINRELELEW